MRKIFLLLGALLLAFPAGAAGLEPSAPRWSLEIKGGRFIPAIENWSLHYGRRFMPEVACTLAYKVFRQLDLGLGAGKASPTRSTGPSSGGDYELVPVQAFVLVRGVTHEQQVVVPYVAGGLTHVYYRTTDPEHRSVRGSASGYHVRGGLQFLLDGLDAKASREMYRSYGVFRTYLFIEAERMRVMVPSTPIDVGGTAYVVGLLFEL